MSPLVTINGLENTGEQEQANKNNEKINCKKFKEKNIALCQPSVHAQDYQEMTITANSAMIQACTLF